MNVNFHAYRPNLTENCSICIEPLESEVVAHEGDGTKHPVHKECVKSWVKIHSSCPICKITVNPTSLGISTIQCISERLKHLAGCIGTIANALLQLFALSAMASSIGYNVTIFITPWYSGEGCATTNVTRLVTSIFTSYIVGVVSMPIFPNRPIQSLLCISAITTALLCFQFVVEPSLCER